MIPHQLSRFLLFCISAFLLLSSPALSAGKPLSVSENGRYFVDRNGKPFFYLADSGLELFHLLTREEADEYLKIRAEQGFTVIMTMILDEFSGLTAGNPYGDLPLIDNDPEKPNENYFRHVDYIVRKANSLGLFVAILPTWGDKVNKKWGEGPEIFTEKNAFAS